jgi:glycosyltransferase involved in cell wall biosynthesis
MPKILIASHAAVLQVNRALFYELEKFGYEISFLVPNQWRGDLISDLKFQKLPEEHRFSFFPLSSIFNGNGSLFFYKNLSSVPKDFDFLFIDEEPWSLAALQLCIWARSKKKIFYTKQNLKKKIPFLFQLIEKYVFSKSIAALSVEEEVADVLRWKGYKKDIFDLPHSFDPLLFHKISDLDRNTKRKEWGVPQDSCLALYCGRLTEEKGILDLLQCVDDVPKMHFLFLGNGPLKEKVEDFCSTRKNCTYAPALPHHLIGGIMAIADILVLPSKTTKAWKEQFGRVITEAMACNTMVVGSNSGAIARVIERCGGGVSFPEGDVDALKKILFSLVDHPVDVEKWKDKGKKTVDQEFSHQAVGEKLAKIILKILK